MALSIAGASLLLFVAFLRWADASVGGWSLAVRQGLWVLVAVAPTYGLFFVAPDLQGSRYAYLPAAGGAMLLANVLSTAAGRGRRSRPLLWAAAAAILLMSLVALRLHLQPWQEAASLRDRALAAAVQAARAQDCASLAFGGLPDAWAGAYVFRNGFDAAMRQSAPSVAARLLPFEQASCRFLWDARGFTRTSRELATSRE
jgi:hypothetical protein